MTLSGERERWLDAHAAPGADLPFEFGCRLADEVSGFLPWPRVGRNFPGAGVELTCPLASGYLDGPKAAGECQFATALRLQGQQECFREPGHLGSVPAPHSTDTRDRANETGDAADAKRVPSSKRKTFAEGRRCIAYDHRGSGESPVATVTRRLAW